MKKGQKIKLYGGIIGEIQALGKETVDLRVKSGTVIEVERSAVAEIMQ
ncbi:preprotein translocase subunit YajC [Enterococcus casseliflavus]|nr:preprotein translocase subunit YajC [Enterococcus casseliflavus]